MNEQYRAYRIKIESLEKKILTELHAPMCACDIEVITCDVLKFRKSYVTHCIRKTDNFKSL